MPCTRCPKSLGQFLKHHISKITIHDEKFETSSERKKNLGNYFDTKLDPICDTSVDRYKLNDLAVYTHTTKHYLHQLL